MKSRRSPKSRSLHVIDDLDTLRVLADPLRNQILEAVLLEPMTVKRIAQRLGLAPNKLYYHVNLLEEHGLIEVVDTRMVSGIVEKTYRAVADSYTVDRKLLSSRTEQGRESILTTLTAVIDATREDLLRSLEARYGEPDEEGKHQPSRVMLNRSQKRLTRAEARRFLRRLRRLTEDFDEATEPQADEEQGTQTFALTVAFYPSFYFAEEETTDDS